MTAEFTNGGLGGIWSSSIHANHKMTDEQARIQNLEAVEATLRAELAHFTQSGIVEIAVRNPSVKEHMKHWEQRAETAEAEVARLTALVASQAEQMERLREMIQCLHEEAAGESI